MARKTSFTYKLTAPQQETLGDILRAGNYMPAQVAHAKVAVKTPDCNVTLYRSGKCLIQGKGAEDFVSFVMEPLVLQKIEYGYEDTISPELAEAHMGIDESGKGDFFGPLVVAAAFVDARLFEEMKKLDVRDSKTITSDKKVLGMGKALRKLLRNRFSTVKIGPRAYNRLYAKMRNVNTMLSWAHARAIEDLLEVVPECPRAVSDQFGRKDQVEKALMKKGRRINLVQRHRAESDIAVAAASIIAREQFLLALKGMEKEYETTIPKGASGAVRKSAVELARARGPEILLDAAKCHFKTTDAVLEELGADRTSLGPDGAATSKPVRRFRPKRGS